MFIGQGIVVPQPSARVSNLSVPRPIASIVGLTDNPTYGPTLQIGQEANYTLASSSGTVSAWSWGQLIAADGGTTEDYGNGPNPTDLSAADGDVVIAAVLVDGDWSYTSAVPVRRAPPVPGSLILPDVVEGAVPIALDVSGAIDGDEVALSLVAPLPGVLLSGNTLQIDGAQFAAQSGVSLTLRGINTGGAADISASFDILSSDISATVLPAAGDGLYETLTFGDLPEIGTFQNPGNYSSASGVIGVTTSFVKNSSVAAETDTVLENDTWRIDFTVSQNAGADRVFSISGTCAYFFTTTALPDGNLSLEINPDVPDDETLDLEINATSYSGLSVGAIRAGPFHAGGAGIGFAGLVADLGAGDTLTADIGDWLTAAGALTFTCQWMRDGVDIPGATNDSYDLVPADLGTDISLALHGDDGTAITTVVTPPISLPGGVSGTEFARVGRRSVDNNSALSHTLTDVDLGSPAAGRVIYIAAARFFEATALTVGGLPATLVAGVDNGNGPGFNSAVSLWKVALPTGASADIVITGPMASIATAVEIYRTIGLVEKLSTTSTASTPDLSLNTDDGDFILGTMMMTNGTQVVWTGLTEDFESDIRSGEYFSVASAQNVTAATPHSILATPDGTAAGHAAVAITLEAIS